MQNVSQQPGQGGDEEEEEEVTSGWEEEGSRFGMKVQAT